MSIIYMPLKVDTDVCIYMRYTVTEGVVFQHQSVVRRDCRQQFQYLRPPCSPSWVLCWLESVVARGCQLQLQYLRHLAASTSAKAFQE